MIRRVLNRPASAWTNFWFEPMDSIRLDAFRFVYTLSLALYMILRWQDVTEWLTDRGYHVSSEVLFPKFPFSAPLLDADYLPAFGFVLFGSMAAVIFGWQTRAATWALLGCLVYIMLADVVIFYFTPNKLYIVTFFVLALAPRTRASPSKNGTTSVRAAWPVRVLQITLLVQYGTAGWCKLYHGDWLDSAYVLHSQAQGYYCTDLAAWMFRTLPHWSWAAMQHSALAFELLAPILFIVKPLRRFVIVWGFCFQMVIALTMYQLIFFSLQILSYYVLFMDDAFLHRIGGWLQKGRGEAAANQTAP